MNLFNSKLYFNYDELNMIKSYDDFFSRNVCREPEQ